jgi:hypothetical protein
MKMSKNRGRRLLLVPLALALSSYLEISVAAQAVTDASQPWNAAAAAQQNAKNPRNNSSQWDQHFQGQGVVTKTRCQNMTRGANCITAVSRKNAARRAAAARAAALKGETPTTGSATGLGGNAK